jgi:hypothetical protein
MPEMPGQQRLIPRYHTRIELWEADEGVNVRVRRLRLWGIEVDDVDPALLDTECDVKTIDDAIYAALTMLRVAVERH